LHQTVSENPTCGGTLSPSKTHDTSKEKEVPRPSDEHKSTSKDRRSNSKDRRSNSKDRRSRSKERRSKSKNSPSGSKDRMSNEKKQDLKQSDIQAENSNSATISHKKHSEVSHIIKFL